MTTATLSTLSGHLRSSLVMGTLSPVLIFLASAVLFIGPVLPSGNFDVRALLNAGASEVVWLAFLALVITAALHNLNVPIISFVEGYSWNDSYIGRWRRSVHLKRFDRLQVRWTALIQNADELLRETKSDREDLFRRRSRSIGRTVNFDYPRKRDSVLPTRFGNVMRCYEGYADQHYGIAGVVVWPRMLAVLDKDYAKTIEETKASLDFMVNALVLSATGALVLLTTTLAYPSRLSTVVLATPTLLTVFGFALVSYFAYLSAIDQARAWGSLVQGAYDLFRWPLLERFGFEWKPETRTEERELWDAISKLILFGNTGRTVLPPYAKKPYVVVTPPSIAISISRGITSASRDSISFVVRVTNSDKLGREATSVVSYEPLPQSFFFRWGSAKCDGKEVVPTGERLLRFALGELAPNSEKELQFSIDRTDSSTPRSNNGETDDGKK